jgi:hypothetical protein
MSTADSDSDRFDPSRRRLCPDGSCIGLLDDAGRCKVCGRVGGAGPAVGVPEEPEEPEEREAAAAEDEGPGFDPSRRLCLDGTCVGVLGPDGRCKVCGRAEGA